MDGWWWIMDEDGWMDGWMDTLVSGEWMDNEW